MSIPPVKDTRLRAYGQFLAALFFYFLARVLAHRGSLGLASDQWAPVVEQAMLVFLLVFGYAGFGFMINRQQHPISAQGLPSRSGWLGEVGLGLSVGWAIALVCVVVMALAGGIAVRLNLSLVSWGWFAVNLLFFALAAMAEEIAFRGYAFQRFERSVGATGAILGFSLLYAFLQTLQAGWTRASLSVSFLLAVLLSTAYLRTRALWVSWGLNFGWKATRALIFGLTVAGDSSRSPVVQGDPMGPFWLTGAGFGLEGSWLAFLVILLAIPILYQATRDLDYRYNAPEFIPGGIPVDLDAAARQQHEKAMGSTPAAPPLVQITPLAPSPAPSEPDTPPNSGNETL